MIVFLSLCLILAAFAVVCVVLFTSPPKDEAPPPPPASSAPPPPPTPRRPPPDTHETRCAVHEAGHATAAWFCPLVGEITKATIHDEGGSVEYTVASGDDDEIVWARIVISLAGIASELSVYPKARSLPASRDLAAARKGAAVLAKRGARPPAWVTDVASSTIPFGRIFSQPLEPGEREVLSAAYRKARDLVLVHQGGRDRLVTLLLTHRIVSHADMERFFGGRGFMRAVGAVRQVAFIS